MTEEKKSLEVRLARIEEKLNILTGSIKPEILEKKASKEDIDVYLRVLKAGLAADWGEFCGINDCYKCIRVCDAPVLCNAPVLCKICSPCYECTCYPCVPYSIGSLQKGVKEFESLGK